MTHEENESLLVALIQSGDAAAFEKLLLRLYRPLRSYLAAMVGDSVAEDVLQEVSLRIYRQIRFLREPKAFRAWAYEIATRIASPPTSRRSDNERRGPEDRKPQPVHVHSVWHHPVRRHRRPSGF
jgi:DNA-directed RNA polymerase specialized sigma24 family protein